MAYQDTKGHWSQRNQRRAQQFTDQHGRKYFASIELKSGATCGLIEAAYTTPLPVPMMYLEPSKDLSRPYDLYVNYPRWKADIRAERDDWDRRARALAIRRYGPEYDVHKPFSSDILEAVGQAPQAVEPVIAAEQGNNWILGNTRTIDVRLAQYFAPEALDPDFVGRNEPDFRNLDAFEALEEQHDPHALGGKRVEVAVPKSRSKDAIRKAKQRKAIRERRIAAEHAANVAAAAAEPAVV